MSASDSKLALQKVFDAMAVGNTRPFGELMANDTDLAMRVLGAPSA